MRLIRACFCLLFLTHAVEAAELRLVTLASPPAEYVENGHVTGRNVEITRACLDRMKTACHVDILPWKRALLMVEKGTADGIIDAAYNEEREAFLLYPEEEIYVEKWFAFKLKSRQIALTPELSNARQLTIGITRGFEYGGRIQDAIGTNQFKRIQEVFNNEMNIKKLVAGRLDVFLGVKCTIRYHLKKLGLAERVDIVPDRDTGAPLLLNSSKTYVAFSRKTIGPEFVRLFSQTLKTMKQDGTVDRIAKAFE